MSASYPSEPSTLIERLPDWWWGPILARRDSISLEELIMRGTLTASQAHALTRLVASGESVMVAAEQGGAGKSTLLTSLLPSIPVDRAVVVVRGQYETFERARLSPPEGLTLLVNEISPHLPTYCWGPALLTLLELARGGAQVLASMHATTVQDIVRQLAPKPQAVPPELIALLGTVAFLDAWQAGAGVQRRLRKIVRLQYDPTTEGIVAIDIDPAA